MHWPSIRRILPFRILTEGKSVWSCRRVFSSWLELSRPSERAVVVGYVLEADGDPLTADADAADHGAPEGTLTLPAGGTEAFIEVPVLDDDEIEPAREFLRVRLLPPESGADWALGLAAATVVVQEGVCDRSPAVREALRGSRECRMPSVGELAGRGYLGLHRLGVAALRPKDLLGLSGLSELDLSGNPGAPFTLTMELARTDAAPWAPGPAAVEARVREGAPFALSSNLAVRGSAQLSSTLAAIRAGEASSTLIVASAAAGGAASSVSAAGGGAAWLSLSGAPEVPSAPRSNWPPRRAPTPGATSSKPSALDHHSPMEHLAKLQNLQMGA